MGSNRIRFVNPDDKFAGHRFCETGVVEPDGNNVNTWFFLMKGADSPSGPDNPPEEPDTPLPPEDDFSRRL